MTSPLFSGEGPQYYSDAYRHNRPFATAGPYQTALDPNRERAFRGWVQANQVPFDPNAPVVDYDMRGFWQDTGGAWKGGHFPDTYKTPFDTTFSKESKYATPNCPFVWQGDNLVDLRNGQLIFGTPQQGRAVGGPVGPGQRVGDERVAVMDSSGRMTLAPNHGTVLLKAGERLMAVTPLGVHELYTWPGPGDAEVAINKTR